MPGVPNIPAGLSAQADADLKEIHSLALTKQPLFLTDHGRYMQIPLTPASVPSGGATVNPDWSAKPSYQAESAADYGFSATGKVLSYEMHQFYLNDKRGVESFKWVLYGRVSVSGKVYIGSLSSDDPDGTDPVFVEDVQ